MAGDFQIEAGGRQGLAGVEEGELVGEALPVAGGDDFESAGGGGGAAVGGGKGGAGGGEFAGGEAKFDGELFADGLEAELEFAALRAGDLDFVGALASVPEVEFADEGGLRVVGAVTGAVGGALDTAVGDEGEVRMSLSTPTRSSTSMRSCTG